MPETDLFLVFIRRLNSLPFPYMVTGSIAGVLYGEPRVTHDVDLVLAMPAGPGLKRFEEAFGIDEFYCPPTEVLMQECLRRQRGHFNLIHHQSGFKADVYLANEDLFHAWALDRRRKLEVDGEEVHVAPPEYVIVRKLEFYREGQSEKHLRDIRAILHNVGDDLDQEAARLWIAKLGLHVEWGLVQDEPSGM